MASRDDRILKAAVAVVENVPEAQDVVNGILDLMRIEGHVIAIKDAQTGGFGWGIARIGEDGSGTVEGKILVPVAKDDSADRIPGLPPGDEILRIYMHRYCENMPADPIAGSIVAGCTAAFLGTPASASVILDADWMKKAWERGHAIGEALLLDREATR